MNIPFFDLKRQYENLQSEIEPAVTACLASCAYIGGPKVAALESALASYLDVRHAVSCGNGTDALKLALRAVGVKPGDEVVTTPFTFFATAEAIAAVGATPVFIDVHADDYNMDAAQIEKCLTPRTRAILPVHIFGSPLDMDAINAVAKRHGLKVVEDACQAIGAQYKGKRIGGLSDATCFSFYPTKNLGAYGDGGLITTNDDDVANACRALKSHGAGKVGAAAYAQMTGAPLETLTQVQGGEQPLYDPYKYYNYLIGENSRLDGVQATVLLVKLPHLQSYNEKRAAHAARYIEGLRETPLALPRLAGEGSFHCWHQFAVMSDERDALNAYLTAHGVGTGAFYPVPLHLQKAFAHLGYREGDLPVSERLCISSVCLPIYPELTADEIGYVIDTIKAFYRTAAR